MRIIVLIKQILDPAGFSVHRRLERVFINRENYIINPNDKNALEEALRLKDATAPRSWSSVWASLGLTTHYGKLWP